MKKAIVRNWRYGLAAVLVALVVAGLEPLTRLLPESASMNADDTAAVVPLALPITPVPPTPLPLIPTIAPDVKLETFNLSNVPVRRNNLLRPELNPITFQGKQPDHGDFEVYTVKDGDTPIKIADRFNIRAETLLGGNPSLSEEAGLLYVDAELIILPVDGVLHQVTAGDTLETVSAEYGIPQREIIAYAPNNLDFPYRLYPETEIIVPGAVREVFQWEPPKIIDTGGYSQGEAVPVIYGTGTFVWPSIRFTISQVYWYGHPAIDISLLSGSAIYASDTGTVTYAAWSPYCYGNLIVVNHGNGFETFYAHLSSFNVVPGQIVYQGNIIGYSGNTGCSTGPHLHFEIRSSGSRVNPCGWTSGC